MWEAPVPLKIKIFSWQLALDKLPSGLQIHARHGPSNGLCPLCGVPEDASHIFFSCSLAIFAWSVTRQMLGCNWCPTNFAQFHDILSSFSGYPRKLLWILFLAQSWALWNLWSLRCKPREKEGLSWIARELRELYAALKPTPS
ncbi:uncharacterized protein [Lolium perenne]|uniref:uncharacterized protein n=1 Tax=Lolium perenne TaxID=4522 RepID=UPI003A99B798